MINAPKNLNDIEISLYKSGYGFCEKLVKEEHMDIATAVEQTAEKFSGLNLISDIECFKHFLFSEVTAYTEPSIGVINPDLEDKTWWDELKREPSFKSEYWSRYYDYLVNKPAWSISAVEDINSSTDEIMNALANPKQGTAAERMGMVFGYVQSGKTAHYIGMINKAYDAGYRIVIVLSGIHNSLRSQTQSRIDEEVLGYETSLEYIGDMTRERNVIGVGVGPHNQVETVVQSITTRDEKGDVNKKTEGVSMMPPFMIVTKKNASVLRRILRFFRKNHCAEIIDEKKRIPAKYPALIIDDEADQASINTNESYDEHGNVLDDYNPTTINGLIRELLGIFECRSYIGYTATPFANIFIPPHIDDEKYGTDFFPRDFIYRSPRADQYVGAREFFGLGNDEDIPTMPLYRKIVDGASYLGKGTKSTDEVGELPKELKLAVKYFLLSTALRNCRGQSNKPNTMLVHIVRFVGQQNKVKRKVQKYFDEEIANFVRMNAPGIEDEFKSIWENDYIPTTSKMRIQFSKYMSECNDVSWDCIWTEIKRLIADKEISVYSVNGKSEDGLLYKSHEGKPFNVIVIGGDKLSRGLTLEGLTVSYFTRSSNTYDTLMQMGRWFGFRPGYLDACRLFTTSTLYASFSHISMATEDLAAQFDFMNSVVQTPKDFGLRVASHPILEITSRNKMRTGQEFKRDFSCKLSQTRVFDIDGDQYDRNFEAVEDLLYAIKGCRITPEQYQQKLGRKAPGDHFFYHGVSAHDVANFFEAYETSKTATRANSKYMADYIRTMNADGIGGVKSWTVCLINMDNGEKFNIADLQDVGGGILRREGTGVDFSETTASIHTMTSADHEYMDYDNNTYKRVLELKEKYKNDPSKTKISEIIRRETRPFTSGFLILYPIGQAGRLTDERGAHKPPFGFAAVFPDRKGKGELKSYRMNDIALEKDSNEFYG
ncbi:Z1 domain-containing protein [Amedibacillus dolichus]|uniref:Z1 domain-containing protein n=1 Tax=Amedibacillus dolichus TaxID=31971 RepID=UPI0039A3157B